jgi:hypothetical protein
LTPSLEGHLKLNWKSLICFGLGGLPLAILLGVFNFYLYGRIFSTGYEKTFLNYQTFTKIFNINYGVEPFSLFAWQFAPLSVKNYLETLPSILTPVSILLLGLLSPKLWRKNRRTFLIMTSWMIMFFGFYAFYFCTHTEWWYMRFILPAFPAIIIVILVTFQTLLDKLEPAMRKIALYVFTIFILAWSFYASFNLFNLNEKVYFEAAEYAKKNLSQDSIMVTMQTSGSLLHYTNFAILRYDNAEIDDIKKIQKAAIKAKRPIYALLFPHEEKVAKNRISGKWKKLKEIENCTLWCVNC